MTGMFFIVSTGRSGTTTIARSFNQSPDCTCLHEPNPRFIREAPLYHYGDLSGDKIAEVLKETRCWAGNRVYGESSHKLSFLLPILKEVFPGAKFIWLVRDGRQVVASSVARGLYQPIKERQESSEWRRYRLNGVRNGEIKESCWKEMSRFEKNCWRWTRINQIIEKQINVLDLPFRKVRLEEFLSSISRLAIWLGVAEPITGFRIRRHNATSKKRRTWREWTENEQEAFLKWCGDAMDEHYPGWSFDKLREDIKYSEEENLTLPEKTQRIRLQIAGYGKASIRFAQSIPKRIR